MKKDSSEKMWIVCVTTYLPRKCGIATFSADLVESFDTLFTPEEETKVVAMNTGKADSMEYPKKVIFHISENNKQDYVDVAHKLNEMPQVKLISIQHEYGIFGEHDGEAILSFLQEIKKPVAVTFHTVLSHPSDHMKKVTQAIIEKADRCIVMTQTSKGLLETVYDAPLEKIVVVPHGIHPSLYTNGAAAKKSLGFEGKRVVSTFGLLNIGKGIEYALAALPEIIKQYPDIVYAVIGATHPIVMEREGPVYLNRLKEQIKKLGIESHVVFYDRYIETPELLKFLEATDIYLSLSQNPDQAVSGTLSYALGMGRPVVSTPFAQAKEIITPEVGRLVEFNDSRSIAQAITSLFQDQHHLQTMSKTAYFRTRNMTWPNVALSYMKVFEKISPELAEKNTVLPPIKLDHLKRMTDDFGMFQFAILDNPDPISGYTIDDNARAMIAAYWYSTFTDDKDLLPLIEIYLAFLTQAAKKDGGFENYFTVDRTSHVQRNTTENLEDANARAAWALSIISQGTTIPHTLRQQATDIFKKQYQSSKSITSPRAMAFHIQALASMLKDEDTVDLKKTMVGYADFLVDIFNSNSSPDWQWFETSLTYSNAVLPLSLLWAYTVTKNIIYKNTAKSSLDFLIQHSFHDDMCVPIGQDGWFKKGQKKSTYDQQPEEVTMLILALQMMYEATGDEFYFTKKQQAFEWFLGNNSAGQVVYSDITGGCYDGLGENHVNLNQGAESTISYLLARAVMEKNFI